MFSGHYVAGTYFFFIWSGWSLLSRRLIRVGVYSPTTIKRSALFGMPLNSLYVITDYQGFFTATVFLFSGTNIGRKFQKSKFPRLKIYSALLRRAIDSNESIGINLIVKFNLI